MSDLRSFVAEVRTRHGELTPRILVDEVRSPDHEHHGIFNWDDESAAEAYRLAQAGALLRRFKIAYREPTETEAAQYVRAYHSVRGPNGGRSYEPIEEIAQDPVTMKILLRDMARDVAALKRKYGHLEEFWRLVRADPDESAA